MRVKSCHGAGKSELGRTIQYIIFAAMTFTFLKSVKNNFHLLWKRTESSHFLILSHVFGTHCALNLLQLQLIKHHAIKQHCNVFICRFLIWHFV